MKKGKILLATVIAATAVSGLTLAACTEPVEPPSPPPHTEHVDADGNGLCDVCGEAVTPAQPSGPLYKTPTKDDEYWASKAETRGALLKEDVSQKTLAYQFNSIYEQAGSSGDMMRYYVMANLYEDGYFRLYQYRGNLFEYGGYWMNQGDDGGIWMGALEYGMKVDSLTIYGYDQSTEIVADENGKFTFTFSISLGAAEGGQFVRPVTFTAASGEVTYNTVSSYFDHIKSETGETVSELDFSGWTSNVKRDILATVKMSATDGSGTQMTLEFEPDGKFVYGNVAGEWKIIGSSLELKQNGRLWTVTANEQTGAYDVVCDYQNTEGTVFRG